MVTGVSGGQGHVGTRILPETACTKCKREAVKTVEGVWFFPNCLHSLHCFMVVIFDTINTCTHW